MKLRTSLSVLLVALVLNDCGQNTERELPQTEAPPPAGELTMCVTGRLTDEGVECPALRTAEGALFTLAGPTGGAAAGDEVCVCGRPAEMSTCMQGRTLSVSYIGSTCPQ